MCEGCGLVRNEPVPSEDDLERFYHLQYRQEYKGASQPRMRQVARNFRRVRLHLERFADVYADAHAVLDIGAGSGEYAFAIRERGLAITAVEPNADYAAYVREKLGAPVETGFLSTDLVAPRSQDVVHLSHVLEHLRDPVGALRTVRSFLKPGGLVFVEVPDILRYTRRKSRGGMFHYGHIWNFSSQTLRSAAARAGLVESERTARLCEGETHAFFEAGAAAEAQELRDPAHAALVGEAIADHYGKGPQDRSVLKPVRNLVRSVRETQLVRHYNGPAAIGRAILADEDGVAR